MTSVLRVEAAPGVKHGRTEPRPRRPGFFPELRPVLLILTVVFGAILIGLAVGRKPIDGVALLLGLITATVCRGQGRRSVPTCSWSRYRSHPGSRGDSPSPT